MLVMMLMATAVVCSAAATAAVGSAAAVVVTADNVPKQVAGWSRFHRLLHFKSVDEWRDRLP